MRAYYPFDPNPRRPVTTPPALSCDSQFHVLGARDKYPPRPDAAYEMPTATWEAALKMHKALGIERGIIVQPTTYGADHSVTLDGLEALGPNYKGCANASVLREGSDAYLEKLHSAGVRGARFTRQGLGLGFTDLDLRRSLDRVKELGWYVKVQPEPGGIIVNAKMFEKLEMPVIIDHMGRADPAGGESEPNLCKLMELLKRGNFWVMLSLSEKLSKLGPPWDDVIPLASSLIDLAPDRIIWGSDWPHPLSIKPPPNEADLLELLYRFVSDDATLEKILVSNPSNLFGFNS